MSILITICARGGSKGIPGKNIRLLDGKPLIAYSIETARKFAAEYNGHVALSTDSSAIKEIAAQWGLPSAYIRPAELATDQAGKIGVLRDLLFYSEKENGTSYDFILDLDITSPLRTVDDLEQAYTLLKNDPGALNLFSVSSPNRNPYFNMVEQGENGYFQVVKRPAAAFMTRQAAPAVYDMNASFYFYRKSFFEEGYDSAITDRSMIYKVEHLCFDLDHEIDFEFMEFLLTNKKLNFAI